MLKLFRFQAEKSGLSPSEITRVTAGNDGSLPRIDFIAEASQSPNRAGEALKVYKSKTRTVITIAHGVFEAREVLMTNTKNASGPIIGSQELAKIVKPRRRHGYDLLVHVGLSRYLEGKQRNEIRAELRNRWGVEISAGTVTNLCDRFLTYLEALHLSRVPQLREAMEDGYPLHFDATCEHGKGGLLVCMDGWRDWVLVSGRIPTESENNIRPLIEKTVDLFGLPVCTMRDLGEGGAKAIAHLSQQGVVDLVCHYHFLGAIGKKFFDKPHSLLRRILRTSKVRTDLRALLRESRLCWESNDREGRFGRGKVREELPALILWVLEADGRKDAVFPFGLSHFEFVKRCRQALNRAEQWAPCPRTAPERHAIKHLTSIVGRIERDTRINAAFVEIDDAWQAFTELRDVLRLTNAELPRADIRCKQEEIPALELLRRKQIEKDVEQYLEELHKQVGSKKNRNNMSSSPQVVILEYFKRYGDKLFGHPFRYDELGNVAVVVERTNNIPEHFFGGSKRLLRRRLGRANLARDLQQQPAQAALTYNLRHSNYVHIVCGSLENLPKVFAALDEQTLEKATPLYRDHRDSRLERRIRALLEKDKDEKIPENYRAIEVAEGEINTFPTFV